MIPDLSYSLSRRARRYRGLCSVRCLGATLFCTLLLAGCGDVRGEVEVRTLSVDGRGSSYLAAQDGSGAWQPLAAGTATPSKLIVTDPEGRYGVMSLCLDTATGNLRVNVQHGVIAETSSVSAECLAEDAATTVGVSGQVRGLAEGEYGNVYLGDVSALVDSVTPSHRLELPAARYDLVASRYKGEERVPSRLVLEPELSIAAGETIDVDFYGSLSFRPEVAQLMIGGTREGELLSGSVELVTAGGTAARIGEYTGENVLAYARIPGTLAGRSGRALGPGAALRAEVQSFSYNDRTKAGSSRSVSRTLPTTLQKPPQLTLPAPLDLPGLTLCGAATVRPRASWRLHPAAVGFYTQFYSQVQSGHTVSYRLTQSSAWFARRSPSYTLPDFGMLPDWQAVWNLTRSEALFWDVSFTQKKPSREIFVSRSGVLTPSR